MQYVRSLKELNPHIVCILCGGYLVDATTLIECSHSFCKSCIVQYLETSYNCPVCDTEVHKTKPLANIRSDPTLQEIIYKLVPELYEKEREARNINELNQLQERLSRGGNSKEPDPVHEDYDRILVTLNYFRTHKARRMRNEKVLNLFPTRYLCCPLNIPVRVLKKFILQKFDLPKHWNVEVWRADESLLDHLTLADVVRIYGIFRERKPLEISFSVTPQEEQKISDDVSKSCHSMKLDLQEQHNSQNSVSTIAARNILTTTPDPSDDDENKENDNTTKHMPKIGDTTMDIDQDNNSFVNSGTGLETINPPSLSIQS